MHNRILTILTLLLVPYLAAAQTEDSAGSDYDGVRQAVLNYVEGFYEGDSTKIAAGVYEKVHKRGFFKRRNAGDGEYASAPMSYTEMFDYVRQVRTNKHQAPLNAPREIEIFDVQDQTASAKLTAYWGTDYLLLAKTDGIWKIWQVLWQTPSPGTH